MNRRNLIAIVTFATIVVIVYVQLARQPSRIEDTERASSTTVPLDGPRNNIKQSVQPATTQKNSIYTSNGSPNSSENNSNLTDETQKKALAALKQWERSNAKVLEALSADQKNLFVAIPAPNDSLYSILDLIFASELSTTRARDVVTKKFLKENQIQSTSRVLQFGLDSTGNGNDFVTAFFGTTEDDVKVNPIDNSVSIASSNMDLSELKGTAVRQRYDHLMKIESSN